MPAQNPIAAQSIKLHKKLRGKITMESKMRIKDRKDLALVYTPGVGAVSTEIAKNHKLVDTLTWRKNVVAVVSDGSAVLGLGNVGPEAALPVMEGKCAIFKRFAGIDAIPIVLSTQDPKQIIQTVQAIAPSFGAIQLEDIAAPACFEVEEILAKTLSIPVMHDDQHGTAIVALAGLWNALKVVKKKIDAVRVVVNGAGAAGSAIAKLLLAAGVKDLVICDRSGIVHSARESLNASKRELAKLTNPRKLSGELSVAVQDADVLMGISSAGAFSMDLIRSMAPRAIVFAMANPIPEILPSDALVSGAMVVASGRSDFPNQLNNALVYPGLFRGMLDRDVRQVTTEMKIRAAKALAGFIKSPTADRIVPTIFEKGLVVAIAKSVR